jgi:hypothetical protein
MKTVRALTLSLAAALTLTVTSTAFAQEPAPVVTTSTRGGLGIGFSQFLNGPGGADVIFDAGKWHADATLFMSGNGATIFGLGGRGWYHLHSSNMADFSLGGGLGMTYFNTEGPSESVTDFHIDLGGLIRAFITSNVALSGFVGLAIQTGDSPGEFLVSAQPLAQVGAAYYFW